MVCLLAKFDSMARPSRANEINGHSRNTFPRATSRRRRCSSFSASSAPPEGKTPCLQGGDHSVYLSPSSRFRRLLHRERAKTQVKPSRVVDSTCARFRSSQTIFGSTFSRNVPKGDPLILPLVPGQMIPGGSTNYHGLENTDIRVLSLQEILVSPLHRRWYPFILTVGIP